MFEAGTCIEWEDVLQKRIFTLFVGGCSDELKTQNNDSECWFRRPERVKIDLPLFSSTNSRKREGNVHLGRVGQHGGGKIESGYLPSLSYDWWPVERLEWPKWDNWKRRNRLKPTYWSHRWKFCVPVPLSRSRFLSRFHIHMSSTGSINKSILMIKYPVWEGIHWFRKLISNKNFGYMIVLCYSHENERAH